MLAIMIMLIPGLGTEKIAETLRWVFYFFIPHFDFAYGFSNIATNYQNKKTCTSYSEAQLTAICSYMKTENKEFACCPGNDHQVISGAR